MTKLRKQRRKKVFRANINRKRLRNKLNSTGQLSCDEIKKAWEYKKSARHNLEDMGLVYDPNKNLKKSNIKQLLTEKMTGTTKFKVENIDQVCSPTKKHIAEELEKDAKAPRKKMFRLPESQVTWLTYLLDVYGYDYKAMARDKKNYNQETWKQIRSKIKVFMGIPEQYAEYLQNKGLLDAEDEELPVPDTDSD
ncbi:uncharacterized protein CBL_04815 [Carabus blaptoides fortunei]